MIQKNLHFCKIILFVTIFIGLFIIANLFLMPKWIDWNNYYTFQDFYNEPENTIETVFLGSSTVLAAISPLQLYEEYGISSYTFATAVQPLFASYYLLREVYRFHEKSLTTVVLDVSMIRRHAPDYSYIRALSPMRFSINKLNAFFDHFSDIHSVISYNIPLLAFHDRWSALEKNDWNMPSAINSRGQNLILNYKLSDWELFFPTYLDPDEEKMIGDEEGLNYLPKIIDFCSNHSLKLLLVKTPHTDWETENHNEVWKLAQDYGVEFIDFDFSPFLDDLSLTLPLDMFDEWHLNSYGAKKITRWLGKHLIEKYGNQDKRKMPGYEHLDAELTAYHAYYDLLFDLPQKTEVSEYITEAYCSDYPLMVFISIKDDGAASLTQYQRKRLADAGLEQLNYLGYRDSYLAVIKNGEVIIELLKNASPEPDSHNICSVDVLDDDILYSVKSGGFNDGDISSILINGIEYSQQERGINIVVYDYKNNKLIDSVSFDTFESSRRPEALSARVKEAEEKNIHFFELDEDVKEVYLYNRRYANYKDTTWWNYYEDENDFFSFISPFMERQDYVIYLSVKDESSSKLDDSARKALAEKGLPVLSMLETRDSYIGIIDDGKVIYEQKDHGSEPIKWESYGVSVISGGWDSGNKSSILIHGNEYSPMDRGLNVVIYDKELQSVVTSHSFDFYENLLPVNDGEESYKVISTDL